MVAVTARTEFATYVDGDCVSVTSGQTFDVPQDKADGLVSGGLADLAAPAVTEPPETKPAGGSTETKVVEVPEAKAEDQPQSATGEGPGDADQLTGKPPVRRQRQRSRK